jgi:hypothetical protein
MRGEENRKEQHMAVLLCHRFGPGVIVNRTGSCSEQSIVTAK